MVKTRGFCEFFQHSILKFGGLDLYNQDPEAQVCVPPSFRRKVEKVGCAEEFNIPTCERR